MPVPSTSEYSGAKGMPPISYAQQLRYQQLRRHQAIHRQAMADWILAKKGGRIISIGVGPRPVAYPGIPRPWRGARVNGRGNRRKRRR